MRRAGNRVRITAQLIDAASGHHLWADRYDRDLADDFAVQDEIAGIIAGEMAPSIIGAEMQQARRKEPGQLNASDRTMRARWHIRRFTREDMGEALRLLEEAVALDPANAMALSDLSFARHFEVVFGWSDDLADSFARSGEAARLAVAAGDGDAYAQAAPRDLRLLLGSPGGGPAPSAPCSRSRPQFGIRARLSRHQLRPRRRLRFRLAS
ncbi:MAG: hypothetical protein ACM3JG_08635 [Thiohalocapsa sp.]